MIKFDWYVYLLLFYSLNLCACSHKYTQKIILSPIKYGGGLGFIMNPEGRYIGTKHILELVGTVSEETAKSGRKFKKPRIYAVLNEYPKVEIYRICRQDLYYIAASRARMGMGTHLPQPFIGLSHAFVRSIPFYYFRGNVDCLPRVPEKMLEWCDTLLLDPKEPLEAIQAEQKRHLVQKGSVIDFDNARWRVESIDFIEIDITVTEASYNDDEISMLPLDADITDIIKEKEAKGDVLFLSRPTVVSLRLRKL